MLPDVHERVGEQDGVGIFRGATKVNRLVAVLGARSPDKGAVLERVAARSKSYRVGAFKGVVRVVEAETVEPLFDLNQVWCAGRADSLYAFPWQLEASGAFVCHGHTCCGTAVVATPVPRSRVLSQRVRSASYELGRYD